MTSSHSVPTTAYAKSGDISIAYQVIGNGPIDLVVVPGWISHLELNWDIPTYVDFLENLAGVAVHTGARVLSCAGANEVWVSGTVRDLVTGSGLNFEDRGTRALKGIPGEWRLFAVA